MHVTKDQFLGDVSAHRIEVWKDDGIYRHIVFCKPNHRWDRFFSLTTVPGLLVYSGDMGSFAFSRIEDMFEFFRRAENMLPNFDYWHEKLVAVDLGGSEEPSPERFKENLEGYLEDFRTRDLKLVKEFIAGAVEDYRESGPDYAYRLVNDFDLKDYGQAFPDFFELSDRVHTARFEWACYAIQWGVHRYDEWRASMEQRRQAAFLATSDWHGVNSMATYEGVLIELGSSVTQTRVVEADTMWRAAGAIRQSLEHGWDLIGIREVDSDVWWILGSG